MKNKSTQSVLHCCPVVTEYIPVPYILYKMPFRESEKMLLHSHPDPDQHQKLITYRGPTMFGVHPLECL